MAAPVIHPVQITSVATQTLSLTANLPASIAVGDLLIVVFAHYGTNTTFTPATGWTQKYTVVANGGHAVFLRVADGTEGASFTVTAGNTQNFTAHAYRISSWDGALASVENAPPALQFADGSIGELDGPAVTASWGAADNLVMTIGSLTRTGSQFGTVPAGYTFDQSVSGLDAQNHGAGLSTGVKTITGATDDPGIYVGGTFRNHHSGTLIIRGTGPTLTVTQTELTPGGTISGSYSDYATIPTTLTVSDGTNTITIASPTITDNGDGTGTFSGTMPALPTTGTANLVLFGNVTVSLT